MSRFFEVKARDGAARIGALSLRERRLETPLMLKTFETMRPERGTAISLMVGLISDLMPTDEGRDEPFGAVMLPDVHPSYAQHPKDADFYVLAFSSRMLKSPRDFASVVIDARERISSDAALWIPAIATPENIAILVYMGVDIVDDVIPVLRGYDDVYMLEDGELPLSEMDEQQLLPCGCDACASLDFSAARLKEFEKDERADVLARHNSFLLERELRKVRMRIAALNLREYVEMRVRSSPFLTAVLRVLDAEHERFFEMRAPVARRNNMLANTMESLRRVEVKRFASRVIDRYEPPSEKKVLLILPCAARKPYSLSKSHALFRRAIAASGFQAHVHEIIITSPLGVVPREIEVVYPAAFYDVPVTGYWDAEEIKWVRSCLHAYLERNARNYDAIIVHVDGACAEICRSVADDEGYDMIFTCNDERATSKNALKRLQDEISAFCTSEGLERGGDERAFMNVMRAVADYQFGRGIGEHLIEGAVVRGRYPRLVLYSESGDVLARISEYGMLSLTTAGAHKVRGALGDAYAVRIDDFLPKDTIFAIGVLSADPDIRMNDEVIFSNDRVFGVGRAKMSGWEMVESVRGVAVRVREMERQ